MIKLSPDLGGRDATSRGTAALFRSCEGYLISQVPSMNLDEFVAIRDRIWFPNRIRRDNPGEKLHLHEIVLSLADVLKGIPGLGTEHYDPVYVASSEPGVFNRQRRFRELRYWFATALPPDFLRSIVAVSAGAGARNDDRGLRLCNEMLNSGGISPNVAHLLRSRGFAEEHLHLGAAFHFEDLWVALMQSVCRSDFHERSLESPGAQWDDGRGLALLCLYAALIRIWIARYLNALAPYGRDWHTQEHLRYFLPWLMNRNESAAAGFTHAVPLSLVQRRICSGNFHNTPARFRAIQTACRTLAGRLICNEFSSLDSLHGHDPLVRFLPPSEGKKVDEVLLERSLELLQTRQHQDLLNERRNLPPGAKDVSLPGFDRGFALFFWQYQKIRNTIYRHVVNRPLIPGLHWFVRHFGRLSPLKRRLSTTARLESAATVSGKDAGLSSLEIRTSPPGNADETLAFLKDVYRFGMRSAVSQLPLKELPIFPLERPFQSQTTLERVSPAGPMEFGVVFHIVRNRGGGVDEGRPSANGLNSEAAPGQMSPGRNSNTSGFSSTPRYYRYYRRQLQDIRVLADMIRRYPLSLQVVRGFDACTDELGIPIWVLVPLFQVLRSAAAASKHSLKTSLGHQVPLPRTTVHVGEDYIHIATGLRLIDEALDFLDLREGDRLGHAMALGQDAEEWCRDAGDVTMTVEQRLFDLVWEWSVHSRLPTSLGADRLHFVEEAIRKLSDHVFGDSLRRPPFSANRTTPASNREIDELQMKVAELSDNLRGSAPGPEQLDRLRKNLAQPHVIREIGFEPKDSHPMDSRMLAEEDRWLMYRYLYDRRVFRRSQTTVVVNSGAFAEHYGQLQEALRQKVERLDVAIEINPSSNLLIGDLGELKTHPLWRLNSPEISLDGHAIPIAIGSDDPITFGSTLAEEYQKLADTLAGMGYSETAQLAWLETVRETGMRYRFTLPPEDLLMRPLTSFRSSRYS